MCGNAIGPGDSARRGYCNSLCHSLWRSASPMHGGRACCFLEWDIAGRTFLCTASGRKRTSRLYLCAGRYNGARGHIFHQRSFHRANFRGWHAYCACGRRSCASDFRARRPGIRYCRGQRFSACSLLPRARCRRLHRYRWEQSRWCSQHYTRHLGHACTPEF